ncbi:hypothetical protein ACSFB8_01235 [Enterococcus faecalis]
MLEELLAEVCKTGEKLLIQRSIAPAVIMESQKNQKKLQKTFQEKVTILQESIQATAKNLGSSLKGQFGTKARETLTTQTEFLSSF